MEPIIVWYIRMSILYFVAGAVIGISMLIWPDVSGYYVTTHAHLNLLGFMSMMIYGVGYHILPKFSGKHIYSPQIMRLQFWIANAGLIGLAISWPATQWFGGPFFNALLILSALFTLLSVVLFAVNIFKTIQPMQMPR